LFDEASILGDILLIILAAVLVFAYYTEIRLARSNFDRTSVSPRPGTA
jgi:hypothetical protein